MKRSVSILLILSVFIFLCACSSAVDLTGSDAAERILEISEDPTSYLGKTLKVSGYYTSETFAGTTYHYVMKTTPDAAQNVGFEIRWKGEYPPSGTAVSVTGTLMTETVYGQAYIFLDVTEFHILQRVG
mgnify:CR=1 FL=1